MDHVVGKGTLDKRQENEYEVLSRVSHWESKLPSKVILTATEKFSPEREPKTRQNWTRGRKMVSEELRFSKVDVKRRQQLFENMANKQTTATTKNFQPSRRSHSTESCKVKELASVRNERSLSAESVYRKNQAKPKVKADISQIKNKLNKIKGTAPELRDITSGKSEQQRVAIDEKNHVSQTQKNEAKPEARTGITQIKKKFNKVKGTEQVSNVIANVTFLQQPATQNEKELVLQTKKHGTKPKDKSDIIEIRNRLIRPKGTESESKIIPNDKSLHRSTNCGEKELILQTRNEETQKIFKHDHGYDNSPNNEEFLGLSEKIGSKEHLVKEVMETEARKHESETQQLIGIVNQASALQEEGARSLSGESKEKEKVMNHVKLYEQQQSNHTENSKSKTNHRGKIHEEIHEKKDENIDLDRGNKTYDKIDKAMNEEENDSKERGTKERSNENLVQQFHRSIEITSKSRKNGAGNHIDLEPGPRKKLESKGQQIGPEKNVHAQSSKVIHPNEENVLKETELALDLSATQNQSKDVESGSKHGFISMPEGQHISTEKPSAKPISAAPKRTRSMKIVVTGMSVNKPTPKRATTIVRVNSKGSDMTNSVAKLKNNDRINSKNAGDEVNVADRSKIKSFKKETLQGKQEAEVINFAHLEGKTFTSSCDHEDKASYYRDVRYGLRGDNAMSPGKHRLLSALVSLENTEKARSLGFSDELIGLLREEEGFWKRQVELKKWRETHESKDRETDDERLFDAAKERRIAELRMEHSKKQDIKERKTDDELMIEELLLAEKKLHMEKKLIAEERMLADEAMESAKLYANKTGKVAPEMNSNDVAIGLRTSGKTIFLKQHSFDEKAIEPRLPSAKGAKRFSFPPPNSADRNGSIDSLLRHQSNERNATCQNYNYASVSRVPPLDINRVLRETIVSNGPITYFEHMANVQRKSLVAEPYASHPRRKSIEHSISEVSSHDAEEAGPDSDSNSDTLNETVATLEEETSLSDVHREKLYKDQNQNHVDYWSDPFSPDQHIGSQTFEFPYQETPIHLENRERLASGNEFINLRESNNYSDPSYFSLIENHKHRNEHNIENITNDSQAISSDCQRRKGNDLDKDKHGIYLHEVKDKGETPVKEIPGSPTRTYHVKSVAYRYSKPKSYSTSISDYKNTEFGQNSPENSTLGSIFGDPKSSLNSTKARSFSENELTVSSLKSLDYFSDEETNEDRIREARQLVITDNFRIRCAGCRRLICENLLMTVADKEMFWHNNCFYCIVCGVLLIKRNCRGVGAKVRVIKEKLHCTTCYSQNGDQLSAV